MNTSIALTQMQDLVTARMMSRYLGHIPHIFLPRKLKVKVMVSLKEMEWTVLVLIGWGE